MVKLQNMWLGQFMNMHSVAGFNQECKDICTEVQQLRRKWQRTRHEDDYEAYRQARNRKGRHIQKTLRNNHRQRVEESSSSQFGLWKLVKWAKNRHDLSPACTPELKKPACPDITPTEIERAVRRTSRLPLISTKQSGTFRSLYCHRISYTCQG